ncbi:MAG TPA: patatin-like phospholipase family protein [Gemmatimonadales bacterium]
MPLDLALVLSGGGARAAYQAGAVSALAEIDPALSPGIITGVSAGAINAVALASHPGTLPEAAAALRDDWARLTVSQVYRVRPVSMASGSVRLLWHLVTGRRTGKPAVQGLLDMQPLRTFLARCLHLHGIERNIASGRLRAAALSATCYGTGSTVTFVHGAASVPMWSRAQRYGKRAFLSQEHILASAAIPIVFPAIRLDGRFYGDGSVRQSAPLAPAVHLGARRIIAIGMRADRAAACDDVSGGEYPSSAEVFGMLMHSVFLDALDGDAERLEQMNRVLAATAAADRPPDLRPIALLVLRPSRDLGSMAAHYDVRLPRLISLVVSAMGGRRARASDFLSYLFFDPAYTTDLMDLGYHDTLARRADIRAFLDRPA